MKNNNNTGCFLTVQAVEFFKRMKELKPEQFTILDVRTKEEYCEIHLKGAVNINFFSINFKKEINALDKNQIYFIHCASGKRSAKTLEMLPALGFHEAYDLADGLPANCKDWPIESA